MIFYGFDAHFLRIFPPFCLRGEVCDLSPLVIRMPPFISLSVSRRRLTSTGFSLLKVGRSASSRSASNRVTLLSLLRLSCTLPVSTIIYSHCSHSVFIGCGSLTWSIVARAFFGTNPRHQDSGNVAPPHVPPVSTPPIRFRLDKRVFLYTKVFNDGSELHPAIYLTLFCVSRHAT